MNTSNNGGPVTTDQASPNALAKLPTENATIEAPNSETPVVSHSVQRDLADDVRRRHFDRRIRALVVAADYRMKDRVRHPDGGDSQVEEIIAAEQAQRSKIDEETGAGSKKHQRMPRWIRWVPRFVLCFDFSLLLYFFAGITNVDWSSPLSTALGFAIVLAAMVTLLSYGLLAFTGHRLRGHKNHAGTIHADELDAVTKVIFAVATVVIVVIAMLMFLRMHTEVLDALGPQAIVTATAIAVAIAAVNAAANLLVIGIQALDGSDQVARLERLSAAARKPYAKAHGMREKAARHAEL